MFSFQLLYSSVLAGYFLYFLDSCENFCCVHLFLTPIQLFFKKMFIDLFLIEAWLLCNVILVSVVQQCAQPYVYIYVHIYIYICIHMYKYALPLESSSHPTPLSYPSKSSQSTRWSSLYCNRSFLLAIYFTHNNAHYLNAILSIHPTLSFPRYAHKSVFYICISIAVLQIGSSVSFF